MKQWWNNLTLRERRLVLSGGLALLLISLYHSIWSPLQQHLQTSREQVQQLQQQLDWMHQQAPLVQKMKLVAPAKELHTDIASALSVSSQHYQIMLKWVQPQGDTTQVELDSLSFAKLLSWLDMLEQRYGITVRQIELQPTDTAGNVQIKRLLLGRDGE